MHQIKKKMTGGYTVNYECPSCNASLVSPVSEAGTNQQCPTCNHMFVVPGKEDVLELNRKLMEKKKAAEAEAEAKRKRAAEEAKQNADQQAIANMRAAESERLARIEFTRNLLAVRREEALKPGRLARGMPIGLQIVCILNVIGMIISAVGGILAALTLIGIPVAVGCFFAFFALLATNEVLRIGHQIRNNTLSAAEDLMFLSSLFDAVHKDVYN